MCYTMSGKKVGRLYITLLSQRTALWIMRSRVYVTFGVSTIAFLLFLYPLEVVEHTIEALYQTCNSSYSLNWEEVFVPGQIRTLRIRVNKTGQNKTPSKTILLWTTYFSERYSDDFYFFQKGRMTFEQYNCELTNCFITSNKSLLTHADAVIFHARDINASNIPKRVRRDQIWILYSMEPPKYAIMKWHLIKSLFNWTMTYRSDSHVQVKYGEIVFANDSCRRRTSINENSPAAKRNGAIWMVSNCRTEGRREAYVKELRKYFSVDVYGKCSRRRKCEPSQSKACYKLLSNYKYYLSFENSICKDYVTEKFFNALQYDTVPVVFGGANYSAIAPEHSFVDATLFPSPKALADHLAAIAGNVSWYQSFFDWKARYVVHLHPWMCDLCERLHNVHKTVNKLPNNLWSWWIPGASCRRWSKKKGFRNIF